MIAVDCNTIVVNSKVIRDFFFINEELNLILKGIVNIEAMNLYGSNNIFQIAYQIIANVSYFCIINTMTMNRSLYILFAFFTTFFTPKTVESQIRPTEISGLQLWLRADSNVTLNGTTVSTWNDCSGNGNNVKQSTVAYQPSFVSNIINGNPVLHFDGSNDYLDGGTAMCQVGTEGMSIFIIAKHNGSTGYYITKSLAGGSSTRWALGYADNTIYDAYNGTFNGITRTVQNFEELSVIWNRNTLNNSLYANSEKIGNWTLSNTSPTNSYNFLLGAYNSSTGGIPPYTGYYLNGDIAEIIIYNNPLSIENRDLIEKYLNNKYNSKVAILFIFF